MIEKERKNENYKPGGFLIERDLNLKILISFLWAFLFTGNGNSLFRTPHPPPFFSLNFFSCSILLKFSIFSIFQIFHPVEKIICISHKSF